MNSLLKKAVAAVAVKEIVEKVQEARRPRQSRAKRAMPRVLWAGAAGGVFYLFKTGRLQSLKARIAGGSSNEATSDWSSAGAGLGTGDGAREKETVG